MKVYRSDLHDSKILNVKVWFLAVWRKPWDEMYKTPDIPYLDYMMRLFLVLCSGLLFIFCLDVQLPFTPGNTVLTHSLSDELRALYDMRRLPMYHDRTISGQVSSYDTTGGNDDGFSGKYSYLHRNEDSSLVIFDISGAGVINRIWTPTPTNDTLDFYLDGASRPKFSIRFIDLFSGRQYPFEAPLCGNQLGGYYCYLPIPFSLGCKIVTRGKKIQFHQIQYRLYPDNEPVKSFDPDLDADGKAALGLIKTLWNKKVKKIEDFYTGVIQKKEQKITLAPGQSTTLIQLQQGGRILGMELDPVRAFEGIYKDIDIKITWDGEKLPAVYCPVADFFGYAFGKASMQSLLLGSLEGHNYSYLPMPFDRSATIELIYRTNSTARAEPITIHSTIYYSTQKRNSKDEGKLYTQWNKKLQSTPGQPHVLADLHGKGHFVGTLLQAQGLRAGMTYFFEGDDVTTIDGVLRLHGTGSEDYFNGGWYAMLDRWDGAMSLPLHGALDYSLPYCRTGAYRWYLGDKLSFDRMFYHTIEHGPEGNLFPVDYTSLSFYYSDAPPTVVITPTNVLSKVFVPDTFVVYPQLMDYNIFGKIDLKTSWQYGTGGESYTFTPGQESWLRISLADIPAGEYTVNFDISMLVDGCTFSVWQRQQQISDWISTKSPQEIRTPALRINDILVNDNQNTLTLRFKTDEDHKNLLFHRMMLVRIKG